MTEEEPEIMSLLSASRAGNEAASARLDAAVYSELSAIAAILVLVLGKPDIEWPTVLARFFAPGALSELAGQIIGVTK